MSFHTLALATRRGYRGNKVFPPSVTGFRDNGDLLAGEVLSRCMREKLTQTFAFGPTLPWSGRKKALVRSWYFSKPPRMVSVGNDR